MMETEKEFSNYFLESHGSQSQRDQLIALSKTYWTDLTSHLSSYFSNQDRMKITEKAAQLLAKSPKEIDEAWKDVLRDFNQNQYWGFQQIQKKPKSTQSEDQKTFWKLFRYVWAFFQSMIILKIAVYYFGLESANNPDQTNPAWVWFFFALSVGSLILFAYINREDKN